MLHFHATFSNFGTHCCCHGNFDLLGYVDTDFFWNDGAIVNVNVGAGVGGLIVTSCAVVVAVVVAAVETTNDRVFAIQVRNTY